MKKLALLTAVGIISSAMGMTAYAGQWKQQNGQNWYYDNGDGSWLANGWYWVDGNSDGVSECYYFDVYGILQTGTVVNGYQVNSNGAWVENGVVQTKTTGQTAKERFGTSEKQLWEDIFAARYYGNLSTYGTEYNIGTFVKVLLSESSLGAPYTADGYYYQIPRATLQGILRNIEGDSAYTSNGYSWEQWGIEDTGSGRLRFCAGDFGSSYPYAQILTADEIDGNRLSITGKVGDRETGTNQVISSQSFTAQLEYVPGGVYSAFVERTFSY